MQENLKTGTENKQIEGDWFNHGIPANSSIHDSVYIDTSYCFSAFHSTKKVGLKAGKGSGLYDHSSIITGKDGLITIGSYTIINGSILVCHDQITIGDFVMISWGAVVTDTWITGYSCSDRTKKQALMDASMDDRRMVPFVGKPAPVVIEDNVWVGFNAVIMPGVRLGRGCIVGSKTVVVGDIPPYAIVVGNPSRIVRYLNPTDNEEAQKRIMKEMGID
jgi:maltose O-acetyltransferase